MEFVLKEAKNKSISCSINNKYIHSAYNPEKEAAMFIENGGFNLDKNIYIIVFPGLNYIGKILAANGKKVICIYSDKFLSGNSVFKPELSIYSEENIYSFLKNNLSYYDTSEIEIIFYTPLCNLFREKTEKVSRFLKNYLNEAITSRTTIYKFGKKWIKNALINIREYNPCGFSIVIDKPVLLLGAGPSIESIVKFRDVINKKFTVFTFSSAAAILDNYGINYNYIFHSDTGHYSSYYLYNIEKKSEKMITPFTVASGLFSKYKIFPVNTSLLLESFFFERSGIKNVKIYDNGSVATTAASFLKKNNVRKIFTAGLDFLYKDIKSHSSGHYHYNLSKSGYARTLPEHTVLYKKRISIVPEKYNNYFTGPSLNAYCAWFENENRNKQYIYSLGFQHPRKVFPTEELNEAAGYRQEKIVISSDNSNKIQSIDILKEYINIIKYDIGNIDKTSFSDHGFLENTLAGEFLGHYCPEATEKFLNKESDDINYIKELAENEIASIINKIL